MTSIAHIINPAKVPVGTDLHTAQPITFESIRNALAYIDNPDEVKVYTTQYPEDHEVIPDFVEKLPDLEQSVLDRGSFDKQRKLPLIKDIIDQLYKHSNAEYLIYTNADIILMPFFYEAIQQVIDQGHDAFIINRRRISDQYTSPDDLPAIYAEVGKSHPGFDCFVFKRDLYPKFVLEGICVGVPFIGVSMAHNLFCFGENFKLLDDKHLTVHLGLDVMPNRDKQYYNYNRAEFNTVLEKLKPHLKAKNLPYSDMNMFTRMIKRGLNPSISIGLSLELEGKNFMEKLQELRWQIIQKD